MFSIWLAIASTYYMCVIKGVCSDTKKNEINTPITQKTVTPKIPVVDTTFVFEEEIKDSLDFISNEVTIDSLKNNGLQIYDNGNLLKTYYGDFKIFKNLPKVQISYGISEYGYVIAKHMDSVDSALNIKGYYNKEETIEHGLQRANFIKERLVKLGIPVELIQTSSLEAIFEYNKYNNFVGGIEFNFKTLDSTITFKKIDYSLFKNLKEPAVKQSIQQETTVIKQNIIGENKKTNDFSLNNFDENTAKKTLETPIENKKIFFTVTENSFRNNKFKPNRNFKEFIKTHSNAKSLELVGYSNSSINNNTNYNQAILLAQSVNDYIKSKSFFNGKIIVSALKKQEVSIKNNIREGVTLIIE